MKIFPLLKADVLINNVGSPQQRNLLLQQCALRYEKEPSMFNTNEGCWRSEFNYIGIEWLLGEIQQMLSTAMDMYMKDDLSYSSRFRPAPTLIKHWTNINNPGSSNKLHSHNDVDFVALYYIQGEGTGALTFHNPANLLTNCSLNSPFTSCMSYQPKDGDLLMWPAWMPHEVEVNQSNQHRINIAFNIKL